MNMKNRFSFFLILIISIVLVGVFCESKEEKELARLKKEDPLFYDTNPTIIKRVKALPIGLSEDEFKKWFRIDDPSMKLVGRSQKTVHKHVIGIHVGHDSTVTYNLGNNEAVPPFTVAKVIFTNGIATEKQLSEENMDKIVRYYNSKKAYPSAKPQFYDINSSEPKEPEKKEPKNKEPA